MKILCLFLAQSILLSGPYSEAKSVSKAGPWTPKSAELYVKALKLMDANERGWFGVEHTQSEHASLSLIFQSAWAAQSCLLAGFTGSLTDEHCKPDPSSTFIDAKTKCQKKGYDFPCSPSIFPGAGDGETFCAKSSDQRWTAACAANFFDKMGLKGKTLETLSDADLVNLSKTLNDKKIEPKVIAEKVKALCNSIQGSKIQSDIRDCRNLQNDFEQVVSGRKAAHGKEAAIVVDNGSRVADQPKNEVKKDSETNAKVESTSESKTNSGSDGKTDVAAAGKVLEQVKEINQKPPAVCPAEANLTACTLNAITQGCSIFNKDSDFTFPDGTKLPSIKKKLADAAAINNNPVVRNKLAKINLQSTTLQSADKAIISNDLNECPTLQNLLESPTTANKALLSDLVNDRPSTTASIGSLVIKDSNGVDQFVSNPSYDQVKTYFKAHVPVADINTMKNNLKQVNDNVTQYSILKTGYDPVADAKSTTPEQLAKLDDAVKFAKNALINVVLNGRKESEITPEEQESILKIRMIRYRAPTDPMVYNNSLCNTKLGMAFYMPSENTINICASENQYPMEGLIRTLGHEMGHSIDPCNFQFSPNVFTVSADTASLLSKDNSPEAKILIADRADCDQKKIEPCTIRMLNASAYAAMIKVGVLKSVFAPHTGLQKYPFESITQCLISEQGGGFHSNQSDIRELQLAATDYMNRLHEGETLTPAAQKAENDKIKTLLTLKPECKTAFLSENSKMQEAMADWFGTNVGSAYLKEHPRTADTPENRVKPIEMLTADYCESKALMEQPGDHSSMVDSYIDDPHPDDAHRLEDIQLRDPEFQKYVGCKPSTSFQCKR